MGKDRCVKIAETTLRCKWCSKIIPKGTKYVELRGLFSKDNFCSWNCANNDINRQMIESSLY